MRIVVQRSKEAEVHVKGECVGKIAQGLVLLVGITHTDGEQEARLLAEKIAGLRIFPDVTGKMNMSVREIDGQVLSVSQFTLYGDCRRGRRPSFTDAAQPEYAKALYERFNEWLRNLGIPLETGIFGAEMDVHFTNWGPVTLILES